MTTQPMPKEIALMTDEKVLMVLKRCYVSFATLATIGLIIIWVILGIVGFFTPANQFEYFYWLYIFAVAILPIYCTVSVIST